MSTAATVNSYVDAAVTAIAASDWATAETNLLAASAALVAVPDARTGSAEYRYDRAHIDRLLSTVRRNANAGRGLQYQKIEKVATTD
jgi:hypothetical protein